MPHGKLMPVARKLRRDATDAERCLWRQLRSRQLFGVKFRRQVVIGGHVADFAAHDVRLVIELDGGQHTVEGDRERTELLEAAGWHVLRFWNHDVLGNTEGVIEAIANEIVRIRR